MHAISILKYFFAVLGVAALLGAFSAYKNTQDFLDEAVMVEGRVIELIRSVRKTGSGSDSNQTKVRYRPVIVFETRTGQSVEFTASTGSNPPAYSVGHPVNVLYQESEPAKARIDDFSSLSGQPLILAALGSIFSFVGFSMILSGVRKTKRVQRLKLNGIPVTSKFQRVELNTSIAVNDKSPYIIVTQWVNPETSKLHVFKSDNIWFDPTDHIDGPEITVLIERGNPKRYHVDTSFLPKLV